MVDCVVTFVFKRLNSLFELFRFVFCFSGFELCSVGLLLGRYGAFLNNLQRFCESLHNHLELVSFGLHLGHVARLLGCLVSFTVAESFDDSIDNDTEQGQPWRGKKHEENAGRPVLEEL